MNSIHSLFDKVGIPIITGVFIALFVLETKIALRKRVQGRFQRILINGSVSVLGYGLLRWALIPAMVGLAVQNSRWHFGILYLFPLPIILKSSIGFLLLDYSNYWWHRLNHQVPFLWRFHNVHHTDLDLDVTTAVRFHFMEMLLSIIYRGAAVLIIGATPALVLIYEIVYEACTNFHHSNLKLPLQWEKVLNQLVVTPRMHGIHHSIIQKETDSNYSVIFPFWDRWHRTVSLNVKQEDITIGVPSYRTLTELSATALLKMPFKKQRPWKLPDGTVPQRTE